MPSDKYLDKEFERIETERVANNSKARAQGAQEREKVDVQDEPELETMIAADRSPTGRAVQDQSQ